jgi:hypothetical protein
MKAINRYVVLSFLAGCFTPATVFAQSRLPEGAVQGTQATIQSRCPEGRAANGRCVNPLLALRNAIPPSFTASRAFPGKRRLGSCQAARVQTTECTGIRTMW